MTEKSSAKNKETKKHTSLCLHCKTETQTRQSSAYFSQSYETPNGDIFPSGKWILYYCRICDNIKRAILVDK